MSATVIIVGNLGDSPALEYTANGLAICRLSVASNGWDGKQEVVTWYNVTLFGKKAETSNEKLFKGSLIQVIGSLISKKYLSKNGEQKQSLDVTAYDFKPLSKSPQQEQEFNNSNDLPF